MSLPDLLDRVIAVDPKRDVPLHSQIRQALTRLIDQHFVDGDRFFSEPELIRQLSVSQSTVRRALTDLAREGLLERHPAKGSFVRKGKGVQNAIRTVGVFVPDWNSSFLSGVLNELATVCREKSYRVQIYHTQNGEKVANAYRWVERPPTEEGIILLGGSAAEGAELYRILHERGYRVVAVDRPVKGRNLPFVGTDNRAGVQLGLDHLLSLGHRRIVLLANEPATEPNVIERIEAFQTLMGEQGLESLVVGCGTQIWENSFTAAYEKMPQVMALGPGAIFTVSDSGAWAALKWLAERSIRVPDQVSVLGFDGDPPSEFTYPSLSTVAQPREEIARAAVRILWDSTGKTPHELLVPKLVVRQSTAALKDEH